MQDQFYNSPNYKGESWVIGQYSTVRCYTGIARHAKDVILYTQHKGWFLMPQLTPSTSQEGAYNRKGGVSEGHGPLMFYSLCWAASPMHLSCLIVS